MSWTDERIALLKKMWKEGKSAAEIAKTLGKGVTRNAVIGKAHRMGLSGRPSPIKKPAAAPKKEKEAASAPLKTAKGAPIKKEQRPSAPVAGSAKVSAAIQKEVEELKKIEKEVLPLNGGVALIDLTERMCKWPIGDPREPEFTFCGRGIRQGTPYCPDHAAMAYQTSSRRQIANQDRPRAKVPAKAVVAPEEVVEVEEVEVEVDDTVEDDEDEEVTA